MPFAFIPRFWLWPVIIGLSRDRWAIARGNEKGRVERAIRYVRDSFFAARTFTSLDDLNAQAVQRCNGQAADRRCPADLTLRVGAAFAQEQLQLLALPDHPVSH